MIIELFNVDFLVVGIAVAGNLILGFIVFFSQRKSITGVLFVALTIIISIWSVVNYASYNVVDKQITLWLVRLVMFFAAPIGALFLFLIDAFPGERLKMQKKYVYFLTVIMALTMTLALTPFLFSDIVLNSGQAPSPIVGFGIISFIFVPVLAIILGLIILIKRTLKSTGIEKKQYKYLLFGVLIMFGLILLLDFILPSFFRNTRFIPFSALFTLPFVVFTTYAIFKHHLLNIKIITTEITVFALSIVTLFEVIISKSISVILLRSGVFSLVLVFGILLIRSVLKEVEQREEIAKMAEDVKRAYIIEKRAKEELAKLDEVKDQFLMTTQHNLRTPLTSMMGYSDLLLKGIFGKQSKKTLEVIKKFQLLTQGMIKMVNDFLDMAQFQLGKGVVSLKTGVELLPILDEIVTELEFKAKSKGVYLKLDPPQPVPPGRDDVGARKPFGTTQGGPEKRILIKADREKLKAALFNIVDNAVKYTPKGGVTITINPKSQLPNPKWFDKARHPELAEGQIQKQPSGVPAGPANDQNYKPTVLITIKDTGIGIPQEKISTIFDSKFERGDEAKKIAATGSGIGLYLAGQIIKSHNGKVWAESPARIATQSVAGGEGEGKGSVFYVELPLSTNN